MASSALGATGILWWRQVQTPVQQGWEGGPETGQRHHRDLKFFLQLTLSLAATDCLLKGESPPPRAQLSEPAVDRVSGAESEETDTAPGPPPTTRCPEDVGGDRHEAAAPARDVRQRLVVVVVSVTEHHPKVVAVQRVFQDLEVVLPVLGQRQ